MDFRGASAEAVAALTGELVPLTGSGEAASALADGLFSVSQTLRSEPALRRFVTDVSVPTEAKQGLVREVFVGKLPDDALTLVASAVGRRWTGSHDLADALEHLSEVATVRSAGGQVKQLSDELFAFGQVVQRNPELRDALSDPVRSTQDKTGLVDSLLAGKALPATVTLAKQALAGTYRTVSVALAEYQKVAASVHDEGVATVRVAKPLTDTETERLGAALQRAYGRPIHLNLLVDPEVLGGIKVEIGDDVIDGTIASRLDDARRAISG
ncbi:F0F1 ATP synthase subunit delta [Nocardioides sp. CER19]|uniref:F0F1 ATP synthase subunit delta n=1 Tax=Nocardioides sp. CER19 TaxID=3038538 RepID=UPI0024474DA0|nr:F0F1 ATP synthase subunit delta [Nocardioides sp. CER19]MDH2415378.1 F0F1 ATP synthase subunit delta [Nocardioides sp. CER19]